MNFKLYDIDDQPVGFTPPSGIPHGAFPYLSNQDLYIRLGPFIKHQNTEGQCRFLNYGYYYDGSDVQVDKVLEFNNIGENIGSAFKELGINIACNKSIYNANSQNVHYRKNKKVKEQKWWFEGARRHELEGAIKKKFSFLKNLLAK